MNPTEWLFIFVLVFRIAPQNISGRRQVFLSTSELTNIAIESSTGIVYIGGVNTIIKLSPDLKLLTSVKTGPLKDNENCNPPAVQSSCDQKRKLTDNINKILLIYEQKDQLIACGSVYKGFCEMRNLSSLVSLKWSGYNIASSENYSAAAMIAPSENGELKLYVGAFWTKLDIAFGAKTFGVYAFASRNIDVNNEKYGFKVLQILFQDCGIDMKNVADGWKIDNKYVFSSGHFSYFVFSIGKESEVKQTAISRVCQKRGKYDTYVQIPLKCGYANGTSYNVIQSAVVSQAGAVLAENLGVKANKDVLFVVFAKSDSLTSFSPSSESALCVYSVEKLNKIFRKNIELCVTTEGKSKSLPWIEKLTRKKCVAGDDITQHDCLDSGGMLLNTIIGGKEAVTSSPVLEYSKSRLTTILAMAVGNYTAVFVGTVGGDLLKISVKEKDQVVSPYDKISLKVSSDVHKLAYSIDKQSLYIVTGKKVIKMAVQECSKYETCEKCAGAGDPFCGWCSLERRCSVKSKCGNSNLDLRFVQTPDKCVKFASIHPDRVPHGSSVELSVTMENVPSVSPGQSYKCLINDKEQTTTVSLPVVNCTVPAAVDLPPITSDTGDVMVEVALKSSETGVTFAVTKIAFYDCKKIVSCIDCTDGQYLCNWCVYKRLCYASASNCDVSDILVKAKQNRQAKDAVCPQLKANQNLLVPSGVPTTFSVKGIQLPKTKSGYMYSCVVNIRGSIQNGSATWQSSTQLTCENVQFSYFQNDQNYSVALNVYWNKNGESKVDRIGNPHTVSVLLYKCNVDRGSCSFCWNANQELKCGWCYARDSCMVKSACTGAWTTYPHKCNVKPQITRFWPEAGPLGGGTVVEIIGKDLGKQFKDIENTVRIAGFKCQPDQAKYEVSLRILCRTSDTQSVSRRSGPVRVTVDNLTGSSQKKFAFQNPIVRDCFPKSGPESGGSLINITGIYLDTGRVISATVANVPCSVNRTQVTPTSLLCRTAKVTKPTTTGIFRRAAVTSGFVVLSFDGYKPPPPSVIFEFTPDPVVSDILPRKTFVSGGQILTVLGDNFGSIQNPKMFYKRGDGSNSLRVEKECEKVTDVEIRCPSPNASIIGVKPFSNNGSEVCVGFVMDDVQKLQNCSIYLAIVSDPIVFKFDGRGNLRQLKDNQLILKGRNLDIVSKKDVRVTVQNTNCNITSVEKVLLLCLVPEESDLQATDDKTYPVTVNIGNLVFDIGKVKYFEYPGARDITWIWIVAGVLCVLLLLIIFVLLYYHRRKHKKTKKKVENVARELDALESKVAKECREAFAELQTDVTDLTSDLTTFGMPFLEFRYYALRVLFPNQEDHPVLHEREGYPGRNWEAGLRQFSQLIHNKNFLLVFIRTLEDQAAFNMRDRCDVASLLMVSLQGRMEYATEILRHLLCELIKKSVAKRDPKLLLRRTESVAEKMLSDWLAFCMYSFVKLEAGEPLFKLFKAIKRQVEKGPVDAITGDARYSLSEDRLLRQAVEFEKITVSVEYDDTPAENVVLLNCDSISQAKEKILDAIYKNKPYSSRLGRDTLQLEWLHPGGRVRPLRDDDSSSKVEGEWRRINTLSHYKISSGDKLRLSAHQSYFYSPVSISESNFNRSLPSLGYTPTSYTPLAQSDATIEEGGKPWHLVKQTDYPTEKDDPNQGKMLSEIYLTRLLSTKGTLQEFVDVMFKTVFSVLKKESRFPKAIKFLFDLLDNQAKELNLDDEDVLHMWKSNSLPLRFWINIIKNPNFVFDIEKSGIVDSCLSVIAQLFMDSCSISVDTLGSDSPSNKLLYAREIPCYNDCVKRFYEDIRDLPRPTDEEMSDYFADMSMQYNNAFNVDNALKELFIYARKYQEKFQEAFEERGMSSMASKLELVIAAVEE